MAWFGLPLNTLFPYALALVPGALALLIYIHRRREHANAATVPTTLLLQYLRSAAPLKRRFVPPPRFFWQLLLLLLLTLAAANFYWENGGEQIAVLIDNSPSTLTLDQTRGSAANDRQNLFSRIKSETAIYLSALPHTSKVKVFATTPRLHALSPAPVSAATAKDLIGSLQVSFGADNLAANLLRLRGIAGFRRIVVFSDRRFERRINQAEATHPTFDLRTIANSTRGNTQPSTGYENIAIVDAILRTSATSQTKRDLSVSVAAYTSRAIEAELTLQHISPGETSPATIDKRPISLAPGSKKSVDFTDIELAAAYQVLLTPKLNAKSADRLAFDNSAWLTPSINRQVLGVVSEKSVNELGLDQLDFLEFKRIELEDIDSHLSGSNSLAGILFYKSAPQRLPGIHSLFVLPPTDTSLFEVLPAVANANITDWEDGSPLTSYANLRLLTPSSVLPLQIPSWGNEVIESTAGTVLFAGNKGGKRYAVMGFELFPFEGRDSPLTTILTLNSLKWISGSDLARNYIRPHTQWMLPTRINGITSIAGEAVQITHSANQRLANLSTPGLYSLLAGSNAAAVNDSSFIAVNFFDESESNTISASSVIEPAGLTVTTSSRERLPLNAYLLICILALILCDVFIFHRRVAQ